METFMNTLKEHIKNKSFSRVYLLYGTERYLVTLYRKKLKDAILDGDDGMNFNYFEGKDIDWSEVTSVAETLPFFSEHRLILLENTGLFKSSNDFADYLAHMPDTTCLIFCETEVDKRNRLYKAVSQTGYICEMNGLDERNLALFVASLLKKENKKITDQDVRYLLDTAGTDMLNLENETEKLICYTAGREIITRKDIDEVCIQQISGKVFQLTDAIGARNRRLALSHYNTMVQLREAPMMILAMIVRHFNCLLQAGELSGRGSSNAQIASAIGLPPYIAGKYVTQSRNFSPRILRYAVEYGTELEEKAKTGLLNEKIAVEFLVVKLISM